MSGISGVVGNVVGSIGTALGTTIVNASESVKSDDTERVSLIERPMINQKNDNLWTAAKNRYKKRFYYKQSAILMIGSSQSGKSTLGNFLIEGMLPRKKYFEMGTGLKPTTEFPMDMKTTQYIKVEFESLPPPYKETLKAEFMVVDTPGLGDNENKEAQNYLTICERLQAMNIQGFKLGMAILVYKFPTRLTEDYLRLVKAYKDLFPDLFKRNLILVITNVKTSREWKEEMEYNNLNVDDMMQEVQQKIRDYLGIEYDIPTFTINSLPFSNNDLAQARSIRDLIFNRVLQIDPISINSTTIEKPRHWKLEDDKKIIGLKRTIAGMQTGIELTNKTLSELTSELTRDFNTIVDLQESINKDNRTLIDYDNNNKVIIEEQSYHDPWKINPFKRAKALFRLSSPFKITSHNVSGADYKIEESSDNLFSGEVFKGMFSTLNATVTIFTTNRIKYEVLISSTRAAKSLKQKQLADIEQRKQDRENKMTDHKEQLDKFNKLIQEAQIKLEPLMKDRLSVDEFRTRCLSGGIEEVDEFYDRMNSEYLAFRKEKGDLHECDLISSIVVNKYAIDAGSSNSLKDLEY